MFTSRAEHRLLLRQDNADIRLRPIAYQYGMISLAQYERATRKTETISKEIGRLQKIFKSIDGKSVSLAQLLSRLDWTYSSVLEAYPEQNENHGSDLNEQIEMEIKFAGYIERQKKEVAKLEHLDEIKIPKEFDYHKVVGLRAEARQKLSRFTPGNLGQASRISGMTPADISILMIALQKKDAYC